MIWVVLIWFAIGGIGTVIYLHHCVKKNQLVDVGDVIVGVACFLFGPSSILVLLASISPSWLAFLVWESEESRKKLAGWGRCETCSYFDEEKEEVVDNRTVYPCSKHGWKVRKNEGCTAWRRT